MKKSIVIIAGLLLLSVIGIVAYFKPKNEITNSNQVSNEHKVTNNNPTINSVVISSSVQSRQVSSSVQPPALTKAVKINAIDAEKLINILVGKIAGLELENAKLKVLIDTESEEQKGSSE